MENRKRLMREIKEGLAQSKRIKFAANTGDLVRPWPFPPKVKRVGNVAQRSLGSTPQSSVVEKEKEKRRRKNKWRSSMSVDLKSK